MMDPKTLKPGRCYKNESGEIRKIVNFEVFTLGESVTDGTIGWISDSESSIVTQSVFDFSSWAVEEILNPGIFLKKSL